MRVSGVVLFPLHLLKEKSSYVQHTPYLVSSFKKQWKSNAELVESVETFGIRTQQELYNAGLDKGLKPCTRNSEVKETLKQKKTNQQLQLRLDLDYAAVHFGIKKQEDWYALNESSVSALIGDEPFRSCKNGLIELLRKAYPEYEWHPWLAPSLPPRYFKKSKNQRKYMNWIAEELCIDCQEEWYHVSIQQFIKHKNAKQLLSEHKGSLVAALRVVYPEYLWQDSMLSNTAEYPWLQRIPINFWKRKAHQKQFFDWLSVQLGIEQQEDWYAVNTRDVGRLKGYSLLHQFGASLSSTLSAVYDEFEWCPWLFSRTGNNFWNKPENHRKCADWIAQRFGVSNYTDWYSLTHNQLKDVGAEGILYRHNNSLFKMLCTAYPEYEWKKTHLLSEGHRSVYGLLQLLLQQEMLLNHKMVLDSIIELDIYIPALHLAFEYQGKQHYLHDPQEVLFAGKAQTERDALKREYCKSVGITLIEVPYWWKASSLSSLVSTILAQRPDLKHVLRYCMLPVE
jgi:hypothetical protein